MWRKFVNSVKFFFENIRVRNKTPAHMFFFIDIKLHCCEYSVCNFTFNAYRHFRLLFVFCLFRIRSEILESQLNWAYSNFLFSRLMWLRWVYSSEILDLVRRKQNQLSEQLDIFVVWVATRCRYVWSIERVSRQTPWMSEQFLIYNMSSTFNSPWRLEFDSRRGTIFHGLIR